MGIHDLGQVLLVLHVFAIDGDDEVAAQHNRSVALIGSLGSSVQAGFLGSSAGQDALDEEAVISGKTDLLGDVGADGEGSDIERRTTDAA